ncbi:DUF2787 family protein [Vibrio sp. 10N.286.49.B3]|uniref:DUF2787 family protein n=1 Tax=Vibrio sp. 10N.286.49.B3 TaxID=1880855 RepID=UPI001F52DD0B|nr:DUF2787 family protein [Vibrio sp. 10N.286.49.B3]
MVLNKPSCELPISTRFHNAEAGGLHPVEIMICNEGDKWRLCYITDFTFYG